MSDVRRTVISREAIDELVRQQERELPLRQSSHAVGPDEAERKLRREWRRERQAARRQEGRSSQDAWADFIDRRIDAALAREADGQCDAIGEVIARVKRELQDHTTRQVNRLRGEIVAKIGELRGEMVGRLDVLLPRVEALARAVLEQESRGAKLDNDVRAVLREFSDAIAKCDRLVKVLS
jgi:hypothetical protein